MRLRTYVCMYVCAHAHVVILFIIAYPQRFNFNGRLTDNVELQGCFQGIA